MTPSLETAAPHVSVIMAAWNRGRHILPSIRSVLAQHGASFELIVVGDGCTDDTAAVVAPFLSDRLRWVNLPDRGGSQSFANNAGLGLARGAIVAYLGHDDIWAPDHLASVCDRFAANPDCGFVVAGAALHGPEGSGVVAITGLMEAETDAFVHFFPPSSLAHRRAVIEDIGYWRAPGRLRLPVDCEFQFRGALAGWAFRPTGRITVHKFTSTHRYLSYLVPSSDEQEAMLARLERGDMADVLADCVAIAKRAGTYMHQRIPAPQHHAPGEHMAMNNRMRGLRHPPVAPLGETLVIPQDDARRGFDWHPLEERDGSRFRWSGPNPRPRLLLPVTCAEPVEIAIELVHAAPGMLDALRIRLNDGAMTWRCVPDAEGRLWLTMTGALQTGGPSVLAFDAPAMIAGDFARNDDPRRVGFAAGDIVLRRTP